MRSSVRSLLCVSLLLCACGPLVSAGSPSGGSGTSGSGSESSADASSTGLPESSTGPSESSSTGTAEAPTVGVSALAVEPADNEVAVRAFVVMNLEALEGCYEAAQQADPSLTGRFSIEVDIEATGKPAEVSVTDDGLPASLGDCLVDEISTWTFPLDVPTFTTVAIPGFLRLE